MSVAPRFVAALAGCLGALAAQGCLFTFNPEYDGETSGASASTTGSDPTTTSMTSMTTTPPTTMPPTTSMSSTTGGITTDTTAATVTSSTSGAPIVCGDGIVDTGEECDDGDMDDADECTTACKNPKCGDGFVWVGTEECDDGNADDTDGCLTTCKAATCGDGLVQAGVEECDDGNADLTDACAKDCKAAKCGDLWVHAGVEECDDGDLDEADGCLSSCAIPNHCREIKLLNPMAASGQYMIDPDGVGPGPLLPVECNMTAIGGGWTVIEKSPLSMPIGSALFNDKPINMGQPLSAPFRLPKAIMIAIQSDSTELRIDCQGPDYLLTDAASLFIGEKPFGMCKDATKVVYKEAKLAMAPMVFNQAMCTQLRGSSEGPCQGSFGINESDQSQCALNPYPFGGQQVLSIGAYAFAMDSQVKDVKHDCHKPGAVRYVMLR